MSSVRATSPQHQPDSSSAWWAPAICWNLSGAVEWLNVFTFLFMIFYLIPFLLSSKVVTIPEFLARRYGPVVRQIIRIHHVVLRNILHLPGGRAVHRRTGAQRILRLADPLCIVLNGLVRRGWAIYGGLSSVAWTAFSRPW